MSINRKVRGIRGAIPAGYIVGRIAGNGAPQLIQMSALQTQFVAQSGSTPGTTYTNGTGLGLSGTTFSNLFYDADWTFSSHVLTGNLNAHALAAAPNTVNLQLGAADGVSNGLCFDVFANSVAGVSSRLVFRHAQGTGASPSATQSGNILGNELQAFSYGATGYFATPQTAMRAVATESCTDTARGTKIEVFTTPNGSSSDALVSTYSSAGCSLLGTTTNDSAASGFIGEYIESIVLIGAEVALTSTVTADVATVALTAGDWEIRGEVWLDLAATTTVSILATGINNASATLITVPTAGATLRQSFPAATVNSKLVQEVGPFRASVTGTPTMYLSVNATFATSTAKAYGKLSARRIR
jgi:hypothetical protein